MREPTTVEAAGEPATDGYTLLVAVGNPENVEQLLRTAADLARQEGGSIHVVSVVAKDYDSPFGVFDDETIREEFPGDRRAVLERAVAAGDRHEVPVSGEVVVGRSVSGAIVETANAVDADALLVGWTGPTRRTDAVLGSSVDALLERAPVDVYVERIGATADGVERVLVPVAGGHHATLAARAGYAIATANGADLTLLSVAGDGVDRETAREGADDALDGVERIESPRPTTRDDGPGTDGPEIDGITVETVVRAADDVADAIVTAAGDHDVVVMGATRGGPLRARLVGSIPRTVTERTDRTVLLARRWTGPSRLTRLLGRFRRW